MEISRVLIMDLTKLFDKLLAKPFAISGKVRYP